MWGKNASHRVVQSPTLGQRNNKTTQIRLLCPILSHNRVEKVTFFLALPLGAQWCPLKSSRVFSGIQASLEVQDIESKNDLETMEKRWNKLRSWKMVI